MYKCDFKNMCGKNDKLYLCCHFCGEKGCRHRCQDKIWECTYKERIEKNVKEGVKQNGLY